MTGEKEARRNKRIHRLFVTFFVLLAFVPPVLLTLEKFGINDWFKRPPKEVSLPAADDIVSVVASAEEDEAVLFETIPPFELSHDVALRLMDCLRPAVVQEWSEWERRQRNITSCLHLEVIEKTGQITRIEILKLSADSPIMFCVDGQECTVRGKQVYLGMSFLPSINLLAAIQSEWRSRAYDEDASIEIERNFRVVEAMQGRRSIEDYWAWHKFAHDHSSSR